MKPRSVWYCSDGFSILKFLHLHTGSLELSLRDHQVLGRFSYQGPSPLKFGLRSVLGRVLVVPHLFHFRTTEATCLFVTFDSADFFLLRSPDLSLDTILYLSSADSSSWNWFLLWLVFTLMFIVSCETLYRHRCVYIYIRSNQLNLPQLDSNQCVETSQR